MQIMGTVLLCILAALVLLFFLPVTLRLRCDGAVSLKARYLCFAFLLYPRPEKSIRAQDYTDQSLEKRAKKLKKKAAKAAAKKQKKREKKAQKRKKAAQKKAAPPGTMEQIMEQLPLLLQIVGGVVKRLRRYLKVRTASLQLVVASSDSAAAALWYGAAAGIFDTLLGLLESLGTARRADRRNISLCCDFCAEKPQFHCDLRFSLRLWQLAAIALGALKTYLGAQLSGEEKSSGDPQKAQAKEKAQAAARAAVLEEITAKKS